MKKIILLILFLIPIKVLALTDDTVITKTYMSGIYSNQIRNGVLHWSQFATFKAGEEQVYCISPGTPIQSLIYSSNYKWNVTGLDRETALKIELIGYFGYAYPMHQNNYFLMATQKLIWEELGVEEVYFTKQSYGQGTRINLDKYIEEILKLVDEYYQTPSFAGQIVEGFIGDVIKLSDCNNQIAKFVPEETYFDDINIIDKDIYIKLRNMDDISISFRKITDSETMLYLNEGSQTLVKPGITLKNIYFNLDIKILKGTLSINLNGLNGLNEIKKLVGAKYKLKCSNNDEVLKTTDAEGNIVFNNINGGVCIVKEVEAPNGYELDDKEYIFSINAKTPNEELNFVNKQIYKKIVINKFYGNKLIGTCEKEKNIHFAIYKGEELIDELLTDEEGKASIDLPYGIYTFKQINTTEGYLITEPFDVTIDNKTANETVIDKFSDQILIESQGEKKIDFIMPNTGAKYIPLSIVFLLILLVIV